MAKNRNRKGSCGAPQLFERAQRELAKGNTKTAVKDAEACFRQDPCLKNRGLLERAYLGRVEQLQRLRLTAEARVALQKLIDLNPQDPEILGNIPRLQVVVGDCRADTSTVFDREPGLLASLADQAVLDRRSPAPPHAGVAGHIEQIREALAAVERGDDEAAQQAIQGLPRSSPLGEWRLFIRGLSSFYQGDIERMQANWRRLDPKRPAFRIAQTLRVADGQLRPEDAQGNVAESLRQLRARIPVDPAAAPLKDLADHWRQADWPSFFREYRRFRQRFAKSHSSLVSKIVELVWKRAVRDNDWSMLNRLMAVGPCPMLDPNWNRAQALIAEQSPAGYGDAPEIYWQNYMDELPTIACLRDDERSIAVGLVQHHLAGTLLDYAEAADRISRYRWGGQDPDRGDSFRVKAVERLRLAIESCPRLTAAYGDLARLHEDREEPDESAAVLHRLVDIEPDDFDAHVWLANYYLRGYQPGKSEPHVDAALRLRPRDPKCSNLRWNQRVVHVRALVVGGQFDEARRQIDEAADSLREAAVEPFVLDTMRAALEWKAKLQEAASLHLDLALEHAGEPAAVWLAMSVAAAEYRLPRNVKKDISDQFKACMQARPTSRAAGLLARLLYSLKASQCNYPDRDTQERLVLKYMHQARRIRWAEADLEAVCLLLETLPKQAGLLSALVAIGVKQFSENAHFHYWWALSLLEDKSQPCDYNVVVRHLRHARELTRIADKPSIQALAPLVERALSSVYELQSREGILTANWEHDEDEDEYAEGEYDGVGESNSIDPAVIARQMHLFDEDGVPPAEVIEELLAHLAKHLPPAALETAKRELERVKSLL